MKKILLVFFGCCCLLNVFSQNTVRFVVTDAESGEPLSNISILANGGHPFTVSNDKGEARLTINTATASITFSGVNYKNYSVNLSFPLSAKDSIITVQMNKDEKQMDEVIISSGRTDSRIENTPTRVEVLGAEEVEEESGIKPSHIASLLGDIAGIQTQQTSAVTGNTELRIQGLPGNYTQLLRDGMPLFGGYAGNFSILQVPPLELKQIEIIKGSNSTLYGGGAIAGMINIISKKPKQGVKERIILLNQSSLRETNLHLYLSERFGKAGYTFFAGANYQRQEDVNNDGFSDVGRNESMFLHPTFYFYPNEKNTISVGISSNYEDRKGGDMEVLSGYYSSAHQFFIQNQTYRNTLDVIWENKISSTDKFTFKGTTSSFNRNITTSLFGMKAKQLSYFAEASYLKKTDHHDIVAGFNLTGERLRKKLPDSTLIENYNYFAVGLFIQDDWHIHPKLTIETGLRSDFHNIYKAFVLPRISLLYKINPIWTMRLGAGLGYRIPSLFTSGIDERDYDKLQPFVNIKSERSTGINYDINFRKKWGELELIINQLFFYTTISRPLIISETPTSISYYNAGKTLSTKGFETWLQANYKDLEVYLGYTLTDSRKNYDPIQSRVSLSARDKFAGVIAYEFSPKFRVGAELAITDEQNLDDGTIAPAYPFFAGMIRYDLGRFSFVLNCENIFDYRQTKYESIVIPPYTNPRFKQLWAPIDGRVANLSIKIKL